ncbi:5498_t:CDS:2 [Acaulospora morrowiae]|uniref:5498_t:CDS:1 n=1 Tax=Acaulospora morrowiae TaxID=94023 RepID=A0A9N8ZVR5_9GLOM|nr:5498_t:CDS:2 [Acaulospora morrowiae]
MSNSKSYLLSLPNEITAEILGNTKPEDICSISLSNQKFYKFFHDDYVWKLMCKNQYPSAIILEAQKDLDEDRVLKQLFTTVPEPKTDASLSSLCTGQEVESSTDVHSVTEKTNPIIYIAKDRGVRWVSLNGPSVRGQTLWEIITRRSAYGKVIRLDLYDVNVFKVTATHKFVQPGTYDVIWRVKLERDFSLKSLNFMVQVTASDYRVVAETGLFTMRYDSKIDIQSKGNWVEYCPHEIVVPEERTVDGKYFWYAVVCNIYDYSGNPVNGLIVDYVKLRYHQDGRCEVFEENHD